jgi:hypothetical protein
LRLFAIVPERVAGHLGVEFAESSLQYRDVKETSAGAKVCLRIATTGS